MEAKETYRAGVRPLIWFTRAFHSLANTIAVLPDFHNLYQLVGVILIA
jgi:hypothetical protein